MKNMLKNFQATCIVNVIDHQLYYNNLYIQKSFFTFKYDSIEEYQAFFLPLGLPPIFLPLPLPRPLLGRVLVETSTTGGPS